jgi:hypothetical protein
MGMRFSFKLVETNSEELKDFGKMTSYGVIKGTDLFIAGCSLGDDLSVIDYGFCFEDLILDLTAIDIGTCWLGGTFKRSFISRALGLKEDEIIPAITPIGLKANKKNVSDKLVRFLAKGDTRLPDNQLFFEFKNNIIEPLLQTETNKNIKTILEMVKIGPSASNKQPWRIVVESNILHLFWDFDSKYNSMIKGYNIQALDMGIALCHIVKTAEDLQLKAELIDSDIKIDTSWIYIKSVIIN